MDNNNIKSNRKINIVRWGLFAAATVLIVYFLPRGENRHFDYAEGHPWSYGLLTAPFDMVVAPDSNRVAARLDSIDAVFEPVYYREKAMAAHRADELRGRMQVMKSLDMSAYDRKRLFDEIGKVFAAGIVDDETYESIRAGRLERVRVRDNQNVKSVPTGNYISSRVAYVRIDSALADRRLSQQVNSLNLAEFLTPNVLLDSAETRKLYDGARQSALVGDRVIQKGEKIIDKGEPVREDRFEALRTYERMVAERAESKDGNFYWLLAGQTLYVLLCFGALYGFLFFFRHEYFCSRRTLLLIMILMTATVLISFVLRNATPNGLYLVPFAIVPVMVMIFLDARTAFFCHMTTTLLALLVSSAPMEFMFMQFLAGIGAICSLGELTKRSQLLRTAAVVFIAYALGYVTVEMLHNGTSFGLSGKVFAYLGVNAVLMSFAYVAIFLLERTFGFVSKVTLVELSDINNSVLRELSEECPGTFQHSMAVSNLAASAAHRVGANVQLVRAGALYHDIGKIDNPAFFTENQYGVNPHDALDPRQSARIVIGHVSDGLKRAEKAKLPESIRNFIREHHGAGKAKYFFNTWCNAHPDEQVDEQAFTYPGPNPRSKETSILMMADSVEAASRSLHDHTPEAIKALVDKIVDGQIADGLHDDSPLSFKDVKTIKDVFASRLRTMYHVRIQYPERNKPEGGGAAAQ